VIIERQLVLPTLRGFWYTPELDRTLFRRGERLSRRRDGKTGDSSAFLPGLIVAIDI
jgi:hypothetical protein